MKGTVYLIHFDRPYFHAQHYVGWTQNGIMERIERHRNGSGARLLQIVNEVGIPWKVARMWGASRERERQLKKSKNARRYCPICMAGKPVTPQWARKDKDSFFVNRRSDQCTAD